MDGLGGAGGEVGVLLRRYLPESDEGFESNGVHGVESDGWMAEK